MKQKQPEMILPEVELIRRGAPADYRQIVVARLAQGLRILSPSHLAAEVHGFNCAMAMSGQQVRVPTAGLASFLASIKTTEVTLLPEGKKLREQAHILHAQGRHALESGQDIPDDVGELFAPGPIAEGLIPYQGDPIVITDRKVPKDPHLTKVIQ